MFHPWRVSLFLLAALALSSSPFAQTNPIPSPPRVEAAAVEGDAFGTAADTAHMVGAWSFVPLSSGATTNSIFAGRWLIEGGWWEVSLDGLPSGAAITGLELQACDKSAAENIRVMLIEAGMDPVGDTETASLVTEFYSAGGTDCGWWTHTLPAPHPIDSHRKMHVVQIEQPAPNGDMILQGLRVFYRRRVSPAPGAASFADVPLGHPLHQFVEALAASGITAGCGGGNFCPGDPLTRGQMAVFLAKALGLHWPN